jgi:hypothetical protein
MDSTVIEDPQVKLPKATGVGNHVNFADPPTPDLEAEYDEQSPMRDCDDSDSSVDKCQFCESGTP